MNETSTAPSVTDVRTIADWDEPVQHAEQLDAHGRPTGHTRCGADDGLIAVTNWRVDCETCLNWDDREQSDAESGAER